MSENEASIGAFKAQQQSAFEAERQRWLENGQLSFSAEARGTSAALPDGAALPPGSEAVESHVPGSVWKLEVKPGQSVKRGQTLLIVESMKMEITVEAPNDGVVVELLVGEGNPVAAGQRVAVLSREGRP